MILAGSPGLGLAQSHQHNAADNHRERYSIPAVRVDQPPKIDGVLDDEVWKKAPLIDEFTQQEPREGAAASERTEVRVLYDGKTCYIGVHAFDAQPSAIVATEMRRDSDRLLDEDNFQVILDTFNDSRNGYMFVTTPLGAKLEQQISEEGEGNTRGSASSTPTSTRTGTASGTSPPAITDDGWTAEIAIPLATLRFADGAEQTWGINFMRNIRRKNEQVFWAPIPKAVQPHARQPGRQRSSGCSRSTTASTSSSSRTSSSGVRDDAATSAALQTTSFLHDVGVDVKYGVTGGLNLDLTYNTDFAQVEVDEQQVNLTRFSLFFPEKRDFFLENAGQFKMGTGGTFTSTTVETDLFFSRRIGLSDTGRRFRSSAARGSPGKAGRHNIGVLDIQTDSAFGRPGDNFLVARYSSDVLSARASARSSSTRRRWAATRTTTASIGADANLVLGKNLQVNSYVAKTDTPGRDGSDMAFFGRVAYRDPAWNVWLNYLDVQDNFNDEVGFVQRTRREDDQGATSARRRGRASAASACSSRWRCSPTSPISTTAWSARTAAPHERLLHAGRLVHQRHLPAGPRRARRAVQDPQPNVIDPDRHLQVRRVRSSPTTATRRRRFYERFTFQPMEFYGGTRRR